MGDKRLHSLVLGVCLGLAALALPRRVEAQGHTLRSLFSTGATLDDSPFTLPSINNLRQTVYARPVFDPVELRDEWVVMIHDGVTETPFFNIEDAGFRLEAREILTNDGGTIVFLARAATAGACGPGGPSRCLVQVSAGRPPNVLASFDGVGGCGDFAEAQRGLALNNAGQVAASVRTTSDGQPQIVRIDGPGQFTVIFAESPSLFRPTSPSINDSGRVAFAASEPASSGDCSGAECTSVFSGSGGALVREGRRPGGSDHRGSVSINNHGLVVDTGGGASALVYSAQGGVVDTLVAGTEDPVFAQIRNNPNVNDSGAIVFGATHDGLDPNFGLFTGNDPAQSSIVRFGDELFGGTVEGAPGGGPVVRTAGRYLNNLGQIVFALSVTDATGQSTSHVVLVEPLADDVTPPDTTILSGPTGTVASTSAAFTFTANEAGSTFQCSLDGAAFGSCPAGYTGLAQGTHTFQVRATDPAGNTDPTPASRTWTVDTVAPDTTITSGPSGTLASTSATFTFTSNEAGTTFQCSLDGTAFSTCPAGYTGLAQGAHTFQVRAVDAAGNTDPSPASRTWTVDTTSDVTPPDTVITGGPSGSVASTSATFTFSSTEAGSTFQCSLDGSAFGGCPAGYTGLAQGSHTFQVRATDAAGNTDPTPASRTWIVDTVAPDTTILSGPSGSLASTSATFTFTSNEAGTTFQCSLDGAGFFTCPAGYTGLAQGSHTFQVRATDAAGNADPSPASRTWTVDTVAPDTTITSGPSGTVASTSATFTFTSNEAGVTFQCSLDGTAFSTCPAGYTGLAQGAHTFQVRATDAAGNTDPSPASRTWTVDTVAPDTTITGGPSGSVASTSAAFTFTSNEAGVTFQCSLDGAGFSTCPAGYTGLALGTHTFQVRATDGAGNTDPTPASRTWTVAAPSQATLCSVLGTDPSVLDQDAFVLSGTEGEQLRIRISGTGHRGSRAALILADSIDGTNVLSADSSALPNELNVVLPATGSYFVIVGELALTTNERYRGPYCVSVQSSGAAAGSLQPTNSVE